MASPRHVVLVWDNSTLRGQRILSGVYRQAALYPELTLHRFDGTVRRFEPEVVAPAVRCHPCGLIARLGDTARMRALRARLPGIPFVAANPMPPDLADFVVSGDAEEFARLARDHFREQGLETIALLCSNKDEAHLKRTVSTFHAAVPDGSVLPCALYLSPSKAFHKVHRQIKQWLLGLPKPAGVMTFFSHGALHIARACREAGLRVPSDIQIIGSDDVDDCLAFTPHLTSISIPAEPVGELALQTLMRCLRRDSTPPIRTIKVHGASVMPRGSTGHVPAAKGRVSTALEIIRSHATQGITAAKVVKLSKVGSVNRFYKAFRAVTGTTPARLLLETRLDAARRMLRETAAPITTIAETCGFSGSNYFAEVFRRETGHSPSEYRERTERA